jgi:predicted PurR-regulated permease PerM
MKPVRISYFFIFFTFVLVGWLHLATPLVTVLFSYFALSKLRLGQRNWVAVALFLVLVLVISYGFVFFLNEAFVALPDIVSNSIPRLIQFAKSNGVELPFTDIDSLKAFALENVKQQLGELGKFAKIATKESIFLILGLVVAINLFLDAKIDLGREKYVLKNNLYSAVADEISARFRAFYNSFETVMGAQMKISAINTTLTAIFILTISLPYAGVVIGVTFLCGLLPIIGNIIGNSVMVGIAIMISPKLAIGTLIFLVAIHKLEYFLNSKIIGERINNPMWLTLLGLIVGEKLMGIPGMILAPVVLNYIKVEASQIEASGALGARTR